jgi:tetratricopeptide (TPR) repeat protein
VTVVRAKSIRQAIVVLILALLVPGAIGAPTTSPSTAPSPQGPIVVEANAHWTTAVALMNKGQIDKALPEAQSTLALLQKAFPGQDKPGIALSFTVVGFCLYQLDRYDEALPNFNASMEMYRRIYKNADNDTFGMALNNVGWCLYCQERYDGALPYLRQALAMHQRLHKGQDDPNVLGELWDLAECLNALEHYDQALPYYQGALDMKRRVLKGQDRIDLAQNMDGVANCLQHLGRSAEALGIFRDALAMRIRLTKGADRADVAQDMDYVGECLDDLGLSAESLPIYQASLAMRQRLAAGADSYDVCQGLNNIACCLDYLGHTAEALSMYQAGLDMDLRLLGGKDDADCATDMNNVAGCLQRLGHWDQAMKLYGDAWQMRLRIYKGKDSTDIAESYEIIAECLGAMGRTQEALNGYTSAMHMFGRIYNGKDHPDLATAMDNIGICLQNLGKPASALPMNQAALAMRQRIFANQDHPDIVDSMFSVAFDLWFLGRKDEALKMFQDTVGMAERIKSPSLFQYTSALAGFDLNNGNPQDAARWFQESIDSLEQARSILGGDDQDRMGFMNDNQGWNPYPGMVRAQLELGRADSAAEFLDRGRSHSLFDYLERGERIANGDVLDPVEKKARLTDNTEQLKEIQNVRQAVAAAENERNQLTSQINHARAMNDEEGWAQIKQLQSKLNQAYQEYADAHRRMFNMAGQTTFTEATTSAQIQSLLGPHEHLLMYSITPKDGVVLLIPPAGQAISGAYLTEADGKTRSSGQAIQQLIREYRQAVVKSGIDSVRGARRVESSPTTQPAADITAMGYQLFCDLMPAKIWRQIKDDDLVYIIPDPSMSGLPLEMLIPQKPTSLKRQDCVYWLDAGPLLCYGPSASALLELRRQEPDRTGRTYAHEAVLLGDPILQRNAGDHQQLPPPKTGAFVTSVEGGSNAEAVGLRKGAVILGYGSIAIDTKDSFDDAVDKLELMQFHGKLKETPKLRFWVDGQVIERDLPLDSPPGIELADMTPELAATLIAPQPQAISSLAMRGASPTDYGALEPLPGTRKEVTGIYRVLTGQPYTASSNDSVVVLLGEDATNENLQKAARGTRYLHLATHGLVVPGDNARYSSVVLTQPEVVTPQDTGVLTLEDLIEHWWGQLDGTELVVLSACDSQGMDETGSNVKASDGVFGLPWGFMYAGSPAVVASLWEVQDASTAELMQNFYGDMQTENQSTKLAAFTTARRQLKKDFPEPFFWAPFIYLGDPQ